MRRSEEAVLRRVVVNGSAAARAVADRRSERLGAERFNILQMLVCRVPS